MKRRALIAAGLAFALGLLGFLVAASGIVPIAASAGHFAITEWLLQFGKRRSVATHTLGMELPELDEPWMVLKGAGHYEGACRPCHGSPDLPHPRVPQAMLPPPPYLPERIPTWSPEELFYIVKHGIKFTGMPAWPAQQRDDEVRAMVAFLLAFPELDARAYRELVDGAATGDGAVAPLVDLAGVPAPPPAVITNCARCHGADGLGRGLGAFPKLAGQRPEYLRRALQAFARGTRHSGVMQPIAAALDAEQMRELARYYGGLPAGGAPEREMVAGSSAVDRGRAIALRGLPRRGVPACVECHGPSAQPRNPAYPRLAGQYAEYLALQLELFHEDRRGGSPYAHLMRRVASRLTPQQMRDVASYYASLRWPGDLEMQ